MKGIKVGWTQTFEHHLYMLSPISLRYYTLVFLYLRWLVKKSHFLKSLRTEDFLFNTRFKQMVLKYEVGFIRLQSFRLFGSSTIKRWALKNHFTR